MRKITLNEDDMREPCEHNNLATCGTCQRSWCDTCNPTPSARCPFEYDHDEDQEFADFLANNDIKIDPNTPLAPHGGCNWKGCTTCFPPKDEDYLNKSVPRTKEDVLNYLEMVEEIVKPQVDMINERHDTVTYIGSTPSVEETAQYVSVYFPELGNMTVTYETRPFSNGEKRAVVSVDFDVDKLDIIDKRGNDRRLK